MSNAARRMAAVGVRAWRLRSKLLRAGADADNTAAAATRPAVTAGHVWIGAHDSHVNCFHILAPAQAYSCSKGKMSQAVAAPTPPGAANCTFFTAGRNRMASSIAATPGLTAVANTCDSSSSPMELVVPSAAEAAEPVATVASIFSGLPDPPGVLYETLLAIHSTSGLGWAGTLVLSTLLMRLSMLPVSVYSDRNSRKFAATVAPELGKLYQDLSPVDTLGRPRKFESTAEFLQLQTVAFNAVRKLWRKHKCSPLKTLTSPLVQLPMFVSASVAIRRLCGHFYDELQTGGLLWFPDLTIAAMNGFLQVLCFHLHEYSHMVQKYICVCVLYIEIYMCMNLHTCMYMYIYVCKNISIYVMCIP